MASTHGLDLMWSWERHEQREAARGGYAYPAGLETDEGYQRKLDLCAHCLERSRDHADGTKCLALPTNFELFQGISKKEV